MTLDFNISNKIKIGNFVVSNKNPCLIVAELSGNHGGKKKNVFKAIDLISKSGANAVKLQSYEPDTITLNSKKKYFYIDDNSIWRGKYLYDLYKSAYTPFSWHKDIFKYAKKKGLLIFSSPFDKSSVDMLEKLGCPCYKIASPEITDLELINYASKKKKPIIISTGIASIKDINLAIEQCKINNNNKIILLNCISSYPAKDAELNLKHIHELSKITPLVGFSDHSADDVASLSAVALGAKVIEKHFKINDTIDSPDRKFSLNSNYFFNFVKNIRRVESMLGKRNPNKKKILKGKLKTITRSLFFIKDVSKGSILKNEDLRSVRPGLGISPQKLKKILGKKLKKNAKKNTPITKKYF